jgi:hypothetical protein
VERHGTSTRQSCVSPRLVDDDQGEVCLQSTYGCDTTNSRRVEILFMVLYAYVKKIRKERLQKLAELAAAKVKEAAPVLLK